MDDSETLVSAIQLNCQDDLSANLERAETWIHRAAEGGAKLVVLPENFAFMGPEVCKRELAEELGDCSAPIQGMLSRVAREAQVVLVGGGYSVRSHDPLRPFNVCGVFLPDGALAFSYRKMHLFEVDLPDGRRLSELVANLPGDELVVGQAAGFGLGLSICYDLRFPELYRGLVDRGAEVLLAPSAFTLETGKDHWHVLLRARAIESQCWMIAAGQWGQHPKGLRCYGHSLIVDPWGTVVAQCGDGEGICSATITRKRIAEVRRRLPALSHRRIGLSES